MDRRDYNNEEKVKNEEALISLLTLFDEIFYFYEIELIREEELVYFAYEIKLLSESQAIKNYIKQYHELIDSFQYDLKIIQKVYPFTGLSELYKDFDKIIKIVANIG